jgi:NAD(P)-dependent dehydrogenase (short-subunit alcohol dehydrogenase family)
MPETSRTDAASVEEDSMTSRDQRVAVVTGGGRGIGEGISRRLADDGWYVVIVDRDPDTAGSVAAELGDGRAEARSVDVTDREAVLALFADLDLRLGRVDAVVNNAMWVRYAPIVETSEDTLDGMFAIAVKAAFWTIQAAYPIMLRNGGGVIVNMSSPAATRGVDGSSAYSAVKGAVTSLTWQAARELGRHGIRVNGIIPGAVPTPGAREVVDEAGYEIRKKMNALGRLATPTDIANAVAFLVSPDAAYINGHLLAVDGAI